MLLLSAFLTLSPTLSLEKIFSKLNEQLTYSELFDASTDVKIIVVCLFLFYVTTTSLIRLTHLPSQFSNIRLLITANVLLNFSINTAFKSLYVDYSSVSYFFK